jgi:hypothetical protein
VRWPQRTASSCGLVVATMANISDIRETYGPAIVNEAIVATGARLRSVMRGADMLGRCGPSQFAILLKNCSSEQIHVAGDRFVAAIRNDVIETNLGPVWVELTAGGVIVPASVSRSGRSVLAGRRGTEPGRMWQFRHVIRGVPALTTAACWRTATIASMPTTSSRRSTRNASRSGTSPSFRRRPAIRYMYESLLRMKSADGEILPAAHLVPIAEKLGFMQMIDAMVCQTSLKLLAARADTKVSFNLSDSTLRNSYAASRILSIVAEAGECCEAGLRGGQPWRDSCAMAVPSIRHHHKAARAWLLDRRHRISARRSVHQRAQAGRLCEDRRLDLRRHFGDGRMICSC